MQQDFLSQFLQQQIQTEVQKQLSVYMPELYSTAKASKEVLTAIGNAIPHEKAVRLKEHFPKILEYMGTAEGKEVVDYFVSSFLEYAQSVVKKEE